MIKYGIFFIDEIVITTKNLITIVNIRVEEPSNDFQYSNIDF